MIPNYEPTDKLRQDLMQILYDKLSGVQFPEGDFEAVMSREVDRAYSWVCQRIKTSLHPVRSTELPKTAKEIYEDRIRFQKYIDAAFLQFPTWQQLLPAQREQYGDNPELYTAGSLPWDLLTSQQRTIWTSKVQHAPNKITDSEKQDGKNTAYIKLYHAPIVEFHSLALSFVNVPGYQNLSTFFRLYQPNEVLVYQREGAIHIFPAVMARIMNSSQDPLYGSQFGTVAPRIPQVLHIDYVWGYPKAPADLLEAVAIKAAIQVINYITNIFTAGLSGFGVQGFNAQFQNGALYGPLKAQYEQDLRQILKPYYVMNLTGW